MASLYAPLPTLRPAPRGTRRTARGRRDSLGLHRRGLAPPAPCRSPDALPTGRTIDAPLAIPRHADEEPAPSEGWGRHPRLSVDARCKVVDAGLRRHDDVGAVHVSAFRAPGISRRTRRDR